MRGTSSYDPGPDGSRHGRQAAAFRPALVDPQSTRSDQVWIEQPAFNGCLVAAAQLARKVNDSARRNHVCKQNENASLSGKGGDRSSADFVSQIYLFRQNCQNQSMTHCSVRRRLRRTFWTHFEIFRRRFDGVVIYFFNSDFKFFDDASEFSVCSFYVVFIFCLKVHVNFSSVFYTD